MGPDYLTGSTSSYSLYHARVLCRHVLSLPSFIWSCPNVSGSPPVGRCWHTVATLPSATHFHMLILGGTDELGRPLYDCHALKPLAPNPSDGSDANVDAEFAWTELPTSPPPTTTHVRPERPTRSSATGSRSRPMTSQGGSRSASQNKLTGEQSARTTPRPTSAPGMPGEPLAENLANDLGASTGRNDSLINKQSAHVSRRPTSAARHATLPGVSAFAAQCGPVAVSAPDYAIYVFGDDRGGGTHRRRGDMMGGPLSLLQMYRPPDLIGSAGTEVLLKSQTAQPSTLHLRAIECRFTNGTVVSEALTADAHLLLRQTLPPSTAVATKEEEGAEMGRVPMLASYTPAGSGRSGKLSAAHAALAIESSEGARASATAKEVLSAYTLEVHVASKGTLRPSNLVATTTLSAAISTAISTDARENPSGRAGAKPTTSSETKPGRAGVVSAAVLLDGGGAVVGSVSFGFSWSGPLPFAAEPSCASDTKGSLPLVEAGAAKAALNGRSPGLGSSKDEYVGEFADGLANGRGTCARMLMQNFQPTEVLPHQCHATLSTPSHRAQATCRPSILQPRNASRINRRASVIPQFTSRTPPRARRQLREWGALRRPVA